MLTVRYLIWFVLHIAFYLLCCRFGTFAQSILCFRQMAIALLSLICSFFALFILSLILLPHIRVIFLAKLIDTADAITQLAALDCYIVGINPHTIHKNMIALFCQFQLGDEPSLRYFASLWRVGLWFGSNMDLDDSNWSAAVPFDNSMASEQC